MTSKTSKKSRAVLAGAHAGGSRRKLHFGQLELSSSQSTTQSHHLLCTESSDKRHKGLFRIATTPGEDKVLFFSLLFNYLKSLGRREPTATPSFFQSLFLFLRLVPLKNCAVAI